MFRRFVFTVVLAVVGLFTPAHLWAQAPTPTASPSPTPAAQRGLWRAVLPGGEFVVALNQISSVSQHDYSVDGALDVSEVSLSMSGPLVVRFYYQEKTRLRAPGGVGQSSLDLVQERTKELESRIGGDDATRVVKTYPATTHAHTVEYRLPSRQALNALFSSLQEAWISGRGSVFRP